MGKQLTQYLDSTRVHIDNNTIYGEDYLVDKDGNVIIIGYVSVHRCTSIRLVGEANEKETNTQ